MISQNNFSQGSDCQTNLQKWPEEELERVKACPVCDDESREMLHAQQPDRVMNCAPGLWDLYQCNRCRTAYLDPRPTPASIGMAYASYYTHVRPTLVERDTIGRWGELANGYRAAMFNYRTGKSNPLGAIVVPIYARRRRRIEREFRALKIPHPGASLLDVGCGNGEFMLSAENLGWKCTGIDFDEKAVIAACEAGLNVLTGRLEECGLPKQSFDAITLAHVVEHLHDPVGTLRLCHELLKPGGVVSIMTPNLDALSHAAFGQYWRGLETPRHLAIFTFDSLRLACEKAGLKPIYEGCNAEGHFFYGRSHALRKGISGDVSVDLTEEMYHAAEKSDKIGSRFPRKADEIVLISKRVD